MAIPFLDPALRLINTIVDKAIPDTDKRAEIKAQLTDAALRGEFDLEIASITKVNETMQAEAKSEHWMQWSWRPTIGLTFALVIINNYVILPYFGWAKEVIIPSEVWTAMLVILGASAATRGWEKTMTKKKGG